MLLTSGIGGLARVPGRHLFFTGKGGVGKTSIACATAVALADGGRRVLLVSTDPASNLDEVLGAPLGPRPTAVPGVPGLAAMNLDPEAAARDYRERVVGPYREALPAAAVASIEEQLSGACTVEIAAFDEFSKLLGNPATTRAYDHVVFDTAPTGHTLRLLTLPAAWAGFLDTNGTGASCLGPLAALADQRALYERTLAALTDLARTTVFLVSRPESSTLAEAERTRGELAALGVTNLRLVINGRFEAVDRSDPLAQALEARGHAALAAMPAGLSALPRTDVPLYPFSVLGLEAIRSLGPRAGRGRAYHHVPPAADRRTEDVPRGLSALVDAIAAPGRARPSRTPVHDGPGRSPPADPHRRGAGADGQPDRSGRRDASVQRRHPRDGRRGPGRPGPGAAGGGSTLAVHRGDRGLPGIRADGGGGDRALRRRRHGTDGPHAAAARRDGGLSP